MRTLPVIVFCFGTILISAEPLYDIRAVSYFLRGLMVRDAAGCAAAVPHFEIAIRHEPGYSAAWLALARCRGRLGSQTGKLVALEKAVAGNPSNSEALAELGLARHLSGDTAGALRAVEDLARLDKEAAEALQTRMWLIKVDNFEQGTRSEPFRSRPKSTQ